MRWVYSNVAVKEHKRRGIDMILAYRAVQWVVDEFIRSTPQSVTVVVSKIRVIVEMFRYTILYHLHLVKYRVFGLLL